MMPLPLAAMAPTAIGLGSKFLSGLFGGKSKKKKAEADRKATIGAAELKNQMGEDRRLADLSAGQSLLGQLTGKGFTNIDPATAASLGTRREYDFGKAVPEAGAGIGSDLLSGLFGDVGDYAFQYGANQQDDGGGGYEAPDLSGSISPGKPISTLGGSGFMPNDNSMPGVGPSGVSLDDLKNLYKLGGSGTEDFG